MSVKKVSDETSEFTEVRYIVLPHRKRLIPSSARNSVGDLPSRSQTVSECDAERDILRSLPERTGASPRL